MIKNKQFDEWVKKQGIKKVEKVEYKWRWVTFDEELLWQKFIEENPI